MPLTDRLKLRPKTVKPRASPCKTFCALSAGQVASVHLQGSETRCWGLSGRLCGGIVLLLKFRSSNAEDDAGRLGRAPSLPAVLSSALRLEVSGCGEMTEARVAQRGGLKGEGQKQDKSRASLVTPGRSQRPAVRAAFGRLRAGARIPGTVWRIWRVSAFGVISKGKITLWRQFFPEPYCPNGLRRGLSWLQGVLEHRNQC